MCGGGQTGCTALKQKKLFKASYVLGIILGEGKIIMHRK